MRNLAKKKSNFLQDIPFISIYLSVHQQHQNRLYSVYCYDIQELSATCSNEISVSLQPLNSPCAESG